VRRMQQDGEWVGYGHTMFAVLWIADFRLIVA
jgi:hypothetical protein